MSLRRSHLLALGAILIPLVGACSIFSGWSDLQDGAATRADGGTSQADARQEDARSPAGERDGAPDARSDATEPGDPDDPCAPAVCNEGRGCCAHASERTCESAGDCQSGGGFFLRCQTTAECGTAQVCCLDIGGLQAQCAFSCALGDYPLCDPNGDDCSGTCSPAGFGGVYRCR